MPGNAREADLWCGICCCHPPIPCIPMVGPIITFSSDTLTNNRGQARLFDVTIGHCGHQGIIVTASGDTQCNDRGVARCGDIVVGCNIGAVCTCSDNVITNG